MPIGLSNCGMKYLSGYDLRLPSDEDLRTYKSLKLVQDRVLIETSAVENLDDFFERGYLRKFPEGTKIEDAELIYKRNPLEYVERVIFEFTSRCNFRCGHCYNSEVPRTTEPDVHALKSAADAFTDLGIHRYDFVGGEVSLYGDGWLELCRHISSTPQNRVSLVTNGWWLEQNDFTAASRRYADPAEYLASLKDAGLSFLTFSIDGPGAVHDENRGQQGLYRRILDGIPMVLNAGLLPRISVLVKKREKDQAFNGMMLDLGRRIYPDLYEKSDADLIRIIGTDPGNKFSSFIDVGSGAASSLHGFDIDVIPEEYLHCKGFYRPAQLTIKANGELATCRITNAGEGYGNLHDRGMVDILNTMQDRFPYRLHGNKKLKDYLPYIDRRIFGRTFGHMCSLRAILTLLAEKMDENQADGTDPDLLERLNMEVANATGHWSIPSV